MVSDDQWQTINERSDEIGCSANSYICHATAAYALVSGKVDGDLADML